MADKHTKIRRKLRAARSKADVSLDVVGSKIVEEEDQFLEYYGMFDLIRPQYAFEKLYYIYENSDQLQNCVAARVDNIYGFGHGLNFLGDDHKQRQENPALFQQKRIDNFFEYINPDETFTTVTRKVGFDYEVTGNGAYECIRDLKGSLQIMRHAPIKWFRMSHLDTEAVVTDEIIIRDGKPVSLKYRRRFRRYAQLVPNTTEVVWFKEFGDPRILDAKTGRFVQQTDNPANEILWIKRPFAGYAYGVPVWVGAIPDVIGRHSAQYINNNLFDHQGIPPMIVTVSNGILTDESITDLENTFNSYRGVDKFNRVAILESQPESSGLDDKGNAKIEIKNLTDYRKEDLMFAQYLKESGDSIRKIFRLSPLYIGGTEDFNRATAYSAQIVCEQQVFIPERRTFNELINRKIIQKELQCNLWAFKLSGPQIVGSEEITNTVKVFSETGALSINYTIDLVNEALNLEITKIPYQWADLPLFIVKGLLEKGVVLQGLEGVADTQENAKEAVLGLIETVQSQPPQLLSGLQEVSSETVTSSQKMEFPEILDRSLFTDNEKDLYYKILAIDNAIKTRLNNNVD